MGPSPPLCLHQHLQEIIRNCRRKEENLHFKINKIAVKKGDSQMFLESTNKWIDCSNRGGLFEISDQSFVLFRSMEYAVIKVFNVKLLTTYRGENLRDMLMQALLKNRRIINNNWDEISNKIEVDENVKLFF